jgi:predicted ABC-type ATPase
VTADPQLWVFAGPNGAGKTTLLEGFHVGDRIPVVNPDTIARRLDPGRQSEPAIMLKAGRMAASERRKLVQRGQSFAMETTLTGDSELRAMADAQAVGYRVILLYLGLADALTSLARVRQRVAQGGHDVPAPTVLRRYAKSLGNLVAAVDLADRCLILDNTRSRHRLLMTIDGGRVSHTSSRLPHWTAKVVAAAREQGAALPKYG